MDLKNNDFEEDGRLFARCIEPLERYFKDSKHEIYSVYKNVKNGDRDNEYVAHGHLHGEPYMIEFKLWNDNVYIKIMYPYQDPDEYLPI